MKRAISRIIRITAVAGAMSVAVGMVSAIPAGAQATDLPVVTIDMDGSSITVGGALQSGAVQVEATTTAANSDPVLFHLAPGVTADDFYAALASKPVQQDPNATLPYGSIVLNAQMAKGSATLVTELDPGDYVALDATKRDLTKWPRSAFAVAEAAQPAALPAADAKVRAIDFGFRGPKTLHDGDAVRFENDGYVVHMIDGLRTRNAEDAKKVAGYLRDGDFGKANKLIVGFEDLLGVVSPGAVLQRALDIKPGSYVLACFMTTQDGRVHVVLGMVRPITVAKG